MIPCLYPESEQMFSNMGLGGLGDATSIEVTWALNGAYELNMTYPVNGRRYASLAVRKIIFATAEAGGDPQPFRIYKITRPLLGTCTVHARHVVYDLMGFSLRPFLAPNLATVMRQISAISAVQPHGFDISADFDSDIPCNSLTPCSVWNMMGGRRGSILDIYGGEWVFDGFTATLKSAIGADRGLMIRYGKNLRTLEQDENIANTWTALHPYWCSPDGSVCVSLPEHTVSAGDFDYTRVLVIDMSAEFDEQPTTDSLRARALQYIKSNKIGIPDVALDVDFVALEQTEEYKMLASISAIGRGDTVTVEIPTAYDPQSGTPTAFARATSRVVETVWLPLEQRYKTIRLGRKRANFASALATVQKDTAWLMAKMR